MSFKNIFDKRISGFELGINDTMTLQEVKTSQFQLHLIFANLHQVEGNKIEDGFHVSSMVNHKYKSEVDFIKINYFRNSSLIKVASNDSLTNPNLKNLQITNIPLIVEEGKEEIILPTNLFALNNFHKFFQFKVFISFCLHNF